MKWKYHVLRFDSMNGDGVPKYQVRNNWDFFGDWMQLLIHDRSGMYRIQTSFSIDCCSIPSSDSLPNRVCAPVSSWSRTAVYSFRPNNSQSVEPSFFASFWIWWSIQPLIKRAFVGLGLQGQSEKLGSDKGPVFFLVPTFFSQSSGRAGEVFQILGEEAYLKTRKGSERGSERGSVCICPRALFSSIVRGQSLNSIWLAYIPTRGRRGERFHGILWESVKQSGSWC